MKTLVTGLVLVFLSIVKANEIVVAISSSPNSLVPFYSTDSNSQNINRLTHLSLVDFDKKLKIECILCKSYKQKYLGESEILEFELQKNFKYSDGQKITAKDVKDSIALFAENKIINSSFMGSFENLSKVELLDEYKIRLTYNSISPENLSNLNLVKIVKLKKVRENLEIEDVIGAGPFKILENGPLNIRLKSVSSSRPDFVFKVVKDETTLALKLINNEIDISVASMSARKIDWLIKNQERLVIHSMPSGNYIFLALNHKNESLKELKVRKAISHLIMKEKIIHHKLKNTVLLSRGMFSPAFVDMYQERPIDQFDPKNANKLLIEAGFKLDADKIWSKNGQKLILNWRVSNNKSSIEVAEAIKFFLEKNGILVNLMISEWGTFMSNYKKGNFDVLIAQWLGFNGPDMLRFVFHSENIPPKGGNRINYNNPRFDEIIDRAVKERDYKRALLDFKRADDLINLDYAYINLWHPNVLWLAKKCISHLELDPTASFRAFEKMEKNCEY